MNKIDDKNSVVVLKAQNIAFALQSCLDFKEGGEIAENLHNLYSHIKFATKNYIETEHSLENVGSKIRDLYERILKR